MSSTGSDVALRAQVQTALSAFADTPLPKASTGMLSALGYTSEKTADLGSSAETLLINIEQFKPELNNINRDKIKADRWKSCAFLFQLTNDEIPSLSLPSPFGRGAGGAAQRGKGARVGIEQHLVPLARVGHPRATTGSFLLVSRDFTRHRHV